MLFLNYKSTILVLLFLISSISGWEYTLNEENDLDTSIVRIQECEYIPMENDSCSGQSIIPEEDFQGTGGFWTKCGPGGECTITFYRTPNVSVPITISIEVYHHGDSEVRITADSNIGLPPFQGTNSWVTHSLNNTFFPNLPNYSTIKFSVFNTAGKFAVIDKIIIELVDFNPTTTTAEPTTTNEPTTTAEPTTTNEPTTTAEPTTTNEPTTTAEPTTTNEPTTTAEPTTTNEPTTTAEPTTTDKPTTTTQPTSDETTPSTEESTPTTSTTEESESTTEESESTTEESESTTEESESTTEESESTTEESESTTEESESTTTEESKFTTEKHSESTSRTTNPTTLPTSRRPTTVTSRSTTNQPPSNSTTMATSLPSRSTSSTTEMSSPISESFWRFSNIGFIAVFVCFIAVLLGSCIFVFICFTRRKQRNYKKNEDDPFSKEETPYELLPPGMSRSDGINYTVSPIVTGNYGPSYGTGGGSEIYSRARNPSSVYTYGTGDYFPRLTRNENQ